MFLNDGDEDIKLGDTIDNGDTNEGSLTNRKLSEHNNKAHSFSEMKEDNDDFSLGKDDYDLKRAGHPNVCIATVLFKAAAFFMYRNDKIDIFLSAFSCQGYSLLSLSLFWAH